MEQEKLKALFSKNIERMINESGKDQREGRRKSGKEHEFPFHWFIPPE